MSGVLLSNRDEKTFSHLYYETAQLHERIHVSAGIKGMQVCLSPQDLAEAAEAVFTDIT
jgi:prolyl-tRNA editing enzyme YbaK/EbsC (Cys-tRNA(Pro) deacylase)